MPPSSKQPHNYGELQFSTGTRSISMAMFNGYVKLPEGNMLCAVFKSCITVSHHLSLIYVCIMLFPGGSHMIALGFPQ